VLVKVCVLVLWRASTVRSTNCAARYRRNHPTIVGPAGMAGRIVAVVARETGHRCSRRVRSIVVDEAGMVREQTVRSSSLQCRLLVVL
jgi:hypothetical protein